jgi:8-oxo-dGTP diphosphatase
MELIVVGALVRHGRVLLCHRTPERDWFPNMWDLPGGHVEQGEEFGGALCRELREELGLDIAVPDTAPFERIEGSTFDLRLWLLVDFVGEPENTAPEEHDQIGWFAPSELHQLALAHERYPDVITRAVAAADGKSPTI